MNATRAVGIDIGGTKTIVATVDGSGMVHSRTTFETHSDRGFAVGLSDLIGSVQSVLKAAKWQPRELTGIGIGCAGPVNPLRGTLHNPYTLPGWDGVDLLSPLRQSFGIPVLLENDADAAAVGEAELGAGRGANPLVMVTLGTGVGGALLINGAIHRGVNGEHPETGHLPVAPDGPECYCGTRGCWESLASGTAIAAAGQAFGFKDSHSVFGASSGHKDARVIIDRAVNATATATWAIFHTSLPQRIVLGGGIGEEHFETFAPAMRLQISRATQFPKDRVEIVKAQLGNEAGVIGAACLALRNSKSA